MSYTFGMYLNAEAGKCNLFLSLQSGGTKSALSFIISLVTV